MNKGKLFIIFSLIIGAIFACSSFFMGGGGGDWTDDECHDVYTALYWNFAHEASAENWFSIPESWFGTHGNFSFRGHTKDYESLLEGLDMNCSHLYTVEWGGASVIVRELGNQSSHMQLQPAYVNYSTVLWVAIGIFVLFVFGILLRSRGLSLA